VAPTCRYAPPPCTAGQWTPGLPAGKRQPLRTGQAGYQRSDGARSPEQTGSVRPDVTAEVQPEWAGPVRLDGTDAARSPERTGSRGRERVGQAHQPAWIIIVRFTGAGRVD
jgi:hypothetical protein